MSTAYRDSQSARFAQTGLDIASQAAWAFPATAPLGALLGVIATIVGEGATYDDGQPTNQDLKDALDALEVEMEEDWFKQNQNVISDLRDQVMVADAGDMKAYKKTPADYFANDGKNGGADVLQTGRDLLSDLKNNKSNTAHALRALSNYPKRKDLAVSNLGIYILGRTYLNAQIVNRLEICKAVWTYPGTTHHQTKPIKYWSDCEDPLMEQLKLSLTTGLDYAEPMLVALKQAFLERPRKAREKTQNLPNKLQAFPIAFRELTGANYLDKITEAEVDIHLKTMREWRKTLALKCGEPYTKREPDLVGPSLRFLFESDSNGDPVPELDNTKLFDGKIAVQYAGVNSGTVDNAGGYGYYQIDAKLNPAVANALTAAGQLDKVNKALRDEYDLKYGDGRWDADHNLQLGVEHYDTTTSIMVELAPSDGHIGSDVQALIYSLGPESNDMKILPTLDGTTLGGHFETDSQGNRTIVGGKFYPSGWLGISGNYQKLYSQALSALSRHNKKAAAADPDAKPKIEPFAAFRIKLLACDPKYADPAVIELACERILTGLVDAASDYPEYAADIAILVGGESGRRAVTAAAIKAYGAEVNMRGFQIQITPKN